MTLNQLLYHKDGSLKLSMIDVRRLLPKENVKHFNDLRSRGLIEKLEINFKKYLALGGRFTTEKGSNATGAKDPTTSDSEEIIENDQISICTCKTKSVITKVTGVKCKEDIEIIKEIL